MRGYGRNPFADGRAGRWRIYTGTEKYFSEVSRLRESEDHRCAEKSEGGQGMSERGVI